MRVTRTASMLVIVMLSLCLRAQTPTPKVTVTGKLTRAMAIGGESSGWVVHLESETTIEGKPVYSIEVDSRKSGVFDKLENKQVEATGTLSLRLGVETGERTVLMVSSIKQTAADVAKSEDSASFDLLGSRWTLEDLGGHGVLDNIQATLSFPEAGKVEGSGSCNRIFGSATITGNTIKFGPLASTRMACPEGVMGQEAKYLDALQSAERFEWKDPYLLIFCKSLEKPLRFTPMTPAPPAH